MGERERLLAQGREAEIFLQDDGTVVKLMRDPAYEFRVHREVAALRTLKKHGHPVPAALEIVTIDGRPGLVMERLEGQDLLTLLGRQPLKFLAAGRLMGELHATMHDCLAPSDLPDLHDNLREQIGQAPLRERQREAALKRLDELPHGDRACHGDFHVGNVVGSWRDPAVIDWGDASRGAPAADVARTVLLHRFGEPPPGSSPTLKVTALLGRGLLVSRYLATYRKTRPIDKTEVAQWEVVRAAARLCEPVPEEHPRLRRFIEQRFGSG